MTSGDQDFNKDSSYYQGVRSDLIALAPGIHGRVLEIGCAEGLTMEYLASRYNCSVAGLDYCENAIATARGKGYEVYKCNLNDEELPFSECEFDFVLIGDVLEHLYDPWSVLAAIVRVLKDDGTILISIPNVKHYTLLKDLVLRDRWQYCESGLLDVTHIRFFTGEGVKQLISRSGLEVSVLAYNIVQSRFMKILNRLCFRRLHSFLVFHYLVAAKKRHRG